MYDISIHCTAYERKEETFILTDPTQILLEVSYDGVGLVAEGLSVPVHQVLDVRIVVALERLRQNAGRLALGGGSLENKFKLNNIIISETKSKYLLKNIQVNPKIKIKLFNYPDYVSIWLSILSKKDNYYKTKVMESL